MARTLLANGLVALLATLAACASGSKAGERGGTGPAKKRPPQRVLLVDYRSNVRLELVNSSHTDPVEQYSAVRADANRKVQSDDVMSGLVEVLRSHGFDELAQAGPAPKRAGEAVLWAMEIEEPRGVSHAVATRSAPKPAQAKLVLLKRAFLEIYNSTYGLQ
ncbi:MAG TPA: hypothetical protein VMS76_15820, partial [Planctomycetota bacterium]|nr:hypothetical protein [Planctomycetota bacterium]